VSQKSSVFSPLDSILPHPPLLYTRVARPAAPESLSIQSPAVPKGVVVTPLLEPFPLLCAFICVHAGRLKTILHHHSPTVVITQSQHLRCICTIEAVESGGAPLWIPRRVVDQKKINVERMWRSRLHRTIRVPFWQGERTNAGKVRLRSNFPSLGYLMYLAGLGYPWVAASAALPRAHDPWIRPVSDRWRIRSVRKRRERRRCLGRRGPFGAYGRSAPLCACVSLATD
jgi:hypothetical protein